jgi:outer membrane protein assembly factor BamB
LILVMINFSRLLIVFAFVALAGCSTLTELRLDFADKVFGREPPNPPAVLEEISPTYNAKIDWSSNAGKTEKYDYTPALDSSAVYATNTAGEILKLDASNGRQIWRVSVGEPISGGIGVGAGILLVGTNKGNVHAYDVAGKALWKAKVSSEILSVPRYFDGLVIVRTGDNHIFGLDAADGSRKWVYERISPALTLRSSVGLVVDGGAVYAGFAGGKMVAIRADNGKLLWEATVAQPKGVTEIERIADITSLPVVDGPIVYAVAYQGKIAAIDRRSGKVLWNRDISSYSGLNVEDARIFVSHTLGAVYSLDYETGKTFWRQGALANRRLTAPLPMGNLIAVGDLEGYVHFLTRDEGKFAARIKLDSNAVMSLVAGSSATQLIAETRDGGLYAISVAENGAKSTPSPAPEARPEPTKPSEPLSEQTPEPSTERSIMFQKNDSILLPEVEQQPSIENSAPGIYLPSPEAQ